MSTESRYDFVIFGASGFTGQYVVEEAARTVLDDGGKLTWAVAGRTANKLQAVLSEVAIRVGCNLDSVATIMADVAVKESLIKMTAQAKVILNCVGPYQLYGDPVVKACLETGTHYIDICGEPAFLEKVQLLYSEKAREAGVYLLQSCGFDSIPAEMGVVYTKQQFEHGDLNDVEAYLLLRYGKLGGHGNIGTWQSAVTGFSNVQERATNRRLLCAQPLPKPSQKMTKRSPIFYSQDVNSWCLPFVGADRSIVSRTQRYNYEVKSQRPVLFNAYMRVTSFFVLPYLCLVGLIFAICSKTSFGRWLLVKYPGLMSLGTFSSKGPTRAQIKGASFCMTFVGRGYSSHIASADEQHTDKLDRRIVTRISGPEIGYDTTPICMMQCLYVLLNEPSKLPSRGGVFTPGMAFSETTLIQRLQNHNIDFRVLEN